MHKGRLLWISGSGNDDIFDAIGTIGISITGGGLFQSGNVPMTRSSCRRGPALETVSRSFPFSGNVVTMESSRLSNSSGSKRCLFRGNNEVDEPRALLVDCWDGMDIPDNVGEFNDETSVGVFDGGVKESITGFSVFGFGVEGFSIACIGDDVMPLLMHAFFTAILED